MALGGPFTQGPVLCPLILGHESPKGFCISVKVDFTHPRHIFVFFSSWCDMHMVGDLVILEREKKKGREMGEMGVGWEEFLSRCGVLA